MLRYKFIFNFIGAGPLTKVLTYYVVPGKLESEEIAAMQVTDLVLKDEKGYRRVAFVFRRN